MDHHDLAEAVLNPMIESGANIHSCHITASKIYIKGVVEHIQATVPPPDGGHQTTPVVVSPGIVISNSETGEASLTIQPAVHFLRCTNLATWAQHSLRRRHIGQVLTDTDDDIQQFLSERTKSLSDAALWARVSDLTIAALEGKVFNTIVEDLRQARTQYMKHGAATATVERLAEQRGLQEYERSGILEYLMQGGDFTKFGLSNAVTSYSQDVESYERATYLEELGGEVITPPPPRLGINRCLTSHRQRETPVSYYTQYHLTTEPQGSVTQEEVITALLETVDGLNPGDPGHSARTLHWKALMESDWTNWENHERDLALISTQWPKTLFTLSRRRGRQGQPLAHLLPERPHPKGIRRPVLPTDGP